MIAVPFLKWEYFFFKFRLALGVKILEANKTGTLNLMWVLVLHCGIEVGQNWMRVHKHFLFVESVEG